MKIHHLLCASLLAASGFSSVHAADEVKAMTDLVRANGCFSCHSANEKIVGPSFQSVSAKYAGDKDAVANLTQSVRNGSTGKWGSRVAMPPHPSISNDDLKKVITWVLAQKP
ncbi:MAG: cytochrome C [Pseudomonadota bacterium]|nr:cytochrome C [Pseudomonadota bacterium]